jgi:nitrogenase molybdenum-iron protein beta chain
MSGSMTPLQRGAGDRAELPQGVRGQQREEGPPADYSTVAEAPRYTCAFGGAYLCTLATFGAVPIAHSGPGCVIAQNMGMNFGSGLNSAGPFGNTSTPCSCLVEENVIFGGEDKLRTLIRTTLEIARGNLFVVSTGCVPSLTGDDVQGVVREFAGAAHPVVLVKTAGFLGNSYHGYEQYLLALIDQVMVPQPRVPRLVNLFGVVPSQHPFWKGTLAVLKGLLEKIGVQANLLFTEEDGLEAIRRVPAAELNLLLSPWCGEEPVAQLERRFGTPHLDFPAPPMGPKQTSAFLRAVGERLGVDKATLDRTLRAEERRAYRFIEYAADMAMIQMPHQFVGVVGDTSTAIAVTRYASNEQGWLPEIVVVTDGPPEGKREEIRRHLTEDLDSAIKPKVVFEHDSHKIRLLLRKHTVQILLASSLEKYLAMEEFRAMQVSVSFPIFDRVIVDRTYAGYRGGIALIEDITAKYGTPP